MRSSKFVWILTLFTITLFVVGNVHAQAERVWLEQLLCDCNAGFGCSVPIMAVTDSGFTYMAHMWSDDMKIHKFDQFGNLLWNRIYGSGGNSCTMPLAITVDEAGAVYISGAFDPDWALHEPQVHELWTVKYASDGSLAWQDRYEVSGPYQLMLLKDNELSSDGYLYVYGGTGTIYDPWPPDPDNPQFDTRLILLKYNANTGNLEWSQDSNYGKYFVQPSSGWGSGLVLGQNGDVYTAGSACIDHGWCIDSWGDSTHWEQLALFLTHYGSDGSLLGTEEYTDDNFVPCNSELHSWWAGMRNMVGDNQGNLYAAARCYDSTIEYKHYLFKYNSDLGLQWVTCLGQYICTPIDLLVDRAGDIIVTCDLYTFKFNEAGTQIWSGQGGMLLACDLDNNLYVGRSYSNIFDFYNHTEVDPYPEWSMEITGGSIMDMYIDSQGQIYTTSRGGTWCDHVLVGMFAREHYVSLWDARGDTLKNVEFELYKVHNDPPYFTEDKLGNFETDNLGFFKFPLIPGDKMIFPMSMDNLDPDTLSRGDTLRISRYVTDSTAVKHPFLTDNIYSIQLDNLNFDSLGVPSYDTITTGLQDMIIDHTEIRYNLVVSIEWDASKAYLESLKASFQSMSNYLYDVTDGQVRIDTVLIYDDMAHWDEADIFIYADNMYRPDAYVDFIHYASQFGVYLPRKFAIDRRNHTYHEHPLNLDDPIMYRTLVHEWGHYAFGFYDEYFFWDPSDSKYKADPLLRCAGIPYYGFMEYQFPDPDPYTTEMSNAFHYEDDQCKNTQQFGYRNASCWDYFEAQFEGDHINDANDTCFVEIYQPNDTNRNAATMPDGYIYLEGPNNDMTSPMSLDYDVGSKIVFPNWPAHPKVGVKEVDAEIRVGGNLKPNAEVWLNEYLSLGEWRLFKQGNTADNGRIMILGAENGDAIQSSGISFSVTKSTAMYQSAEVWNSGEATIDGDSLTLELTPVDGYFPLISAAVLNGSSFDCQLTAENTFASLPSLAYKPVTGGQYDYAFGSITDGYGVTLTESSGISGNITVNAEDNSFNPFFFINSYTHAEFAPSASSIEFFGPGGESQILFDENNAIMEQAMLFSSPYTIIRTGLTEANIQASRTHSLSVYPSDAMTGSGLMRILYSEAEIVERGGLAEDEATLRVFRWVDRSTGWQEVGGTVDTVLNQVVETITEPGVYAAFTTDALVDVDDEHGDLLPYQFELSQNYPNPFNPVTTIEYSLPRRSHVTIEVYNVLGQKVRSLVDRKESAGSYTITWNGIDASGKSVATGVYLCRFQAGDHIETKKMLLLK